MEGSYIKKIFPNYIILYMNIMHFFINIITLKLFTIISLWHQ